MGTILGSTMKYVRRRYPNEDKEFIGYAHKGTARFLYLKCHEIGMHMPLRILQKITLCFLQVSLG